MITRRRSRHDALYQSHQGLAVRKPGDHKGRPYSARCWRTPVAPTEPPIDPVTAWPRSPMPPGLGQKLFRRFAIDGFAADLQHHRHGQRGHAIERLVNDMAPD